MNKNLAYSNLIKQIGQLLQSGREKASYAVNIVLVQTYWQIGHYIVEYEQNGSDKATYGSQLFERMATDLTNAYGKGFQSFKPSVCQEILFKFSKNSETLSHYLTWSHYFEILKADNELEIGFYTKQTEIEKWSVRELKRQMKSMLFHRLALSKDKEGVLKLAREGHEVQSPADLIKDPFVMEFLKIPEHYQYHESELEQKLIDNLQHFLLELGKGFAFIGRQYRISLSAKHFYVDLVFYHRILKCFVLIDLKRGEIDHQDILYLNYFKKEESTEGDNEPVGIILGAYKDHILVEYATDSITNKILLSKYQLYLPDKALLEKQLNSLMKQD